MKLGYSATAPDRVTTIYTDDLREAKRVGNKLVKERGFKPHVNNPVLNAPHYGRPGGRSWHEIRSEESYMFGWEKTPEVLIYIRPEKFYETEEGGDND